MKFIVKKSEARVTDEHGVSKFFEYETPFAKFSTGVSVINGTYPASGYEKDTEVDACWYVAGGSGQIYIGGEEHTVSEGDMVFIPRDEKFWIKSVNLKLVVTSSPAWFPEQHRHIDK